VNTTNFIEIKNYILNVKGTKQLVPETSIKKYNNITRITKTKLWSCHPNQLLKVLVLLHKPYFNYPQLRIEHRLAINQHMRDGRKINWPARSIHWSDSLISDQAQGRRKKKQIASAWNLGAILESTNKDCLEYTIKLTFTLLQNSNWTLISFEFYTGK
jgi:hypothetical protein